MLFNRLCSKYNLLLGGAMQGAFTKYKTQNTEYRIQNTKYKMHSVQYSGLTGLMHFEEVRGELLLQLLVLEVSSVVCKILSAQLTCAKCA